MVGWLIMRFLPVVLLLGILANFICVIVFRLKLDNQYQDKFTVFSESLKSDISTFTSDALSSIDSYFVSNSLKSASSPSNVSSNTHEVNNPFLLDGGEWNYHYFRIDEQPKAQVGFTIFEVGSIFPRGGSITAIFPDYIVVNNSHFVRNRNLSIAPSSTSPKTQTQSEIVPSKVQYTPNKELKEYVSRTNTNG